MRTGRIVLEEEGVRREICEEVMAAIQRISDSTNVDVAMWLFHDRGMRRRLIGQLLHPDTLVNPSFAQRPLSDLLEFVVKVNIPSRSGEFVAKKSFVVRSWWRRHKSRVTILELGSNFITWFLEGEGKIESSGSGHSFDCYSLLASSNDTSLIRTLGGEACVEVGLGEVFAFMEKHLHKDIPVLQNRDASMVFYVRDLSHTLRAVKINNEGRGWKIGASGVHVGGRSKGCLVFSRSPYPHQEGVV
ncbi:MAG: hypothetical protein K9M10_03580 [Candidatus Pacebacteria bacterium]|nr:hypothetical protein [Candidatus Paceibacterota bacterium]MCF7857532.1 hypothetical protein [Candidatus Paceibacterota bacterium]